MESKSPRVPYHQHHTLLPSPSTRHNTVTTSSSSTNSSSNNNNGVLNQLPTPPPPYPPKPITRSESTNPYPTTFIQADPNSFKQVVQMLTGSSETAKQASTKQHNHHIPPIKTIPKKQQQQSGFKLYERRSNLKNFNLNPLRPLFSSSNINNMSSSGFSPRKPEVLSPSILDFPSLVLSPVTPLIPDPFDRSNATTPANGNGNGSPTLNAEAEAEAEEKAIKEKGFYFHRSPSTTPRDAEPRLLPLFPTTSPRASGSSQSS